MTGALATAPVRRRRYDAPADWRLQAYKPQEVDIHVDIAEAFGRLLVPQEQGGAVWTTIPIGHVRLTGKQADRLAQIGVKPGWGDIVGFWQHRGYLLEVKRRGGQLSADRIVRRRNGSPRFVTGQRTVFPLLEAQGVIIGVCQTVDEALACVARWGWPMRGRVAA